MPLLPESLLGQRRGNGTPDEKIIAEALSAKASPPWMLPRGDALLLCESAGKFTVEKLEKLEQKKRKEYTRLEKDIEKLLRQTPAPMLQKKYEGTKGKKYRGDKFAILKRLDDSIAVLNDIYWNLKVVELVDSK
jgi:hypothetical protein